MIKRFVAIIRVSSTYFKTKIEAESIEKAEQIIEKTIIGLIIK